MAMDNSVKITGMIVIAVLVVAFLVFYVANPDSTGETVRSEGISTVNAIPDRVSVYLSIETNASTAKEAKDLNSEISERVIASLLEEGFSREEIETMNFNVYEEYDWTKNGRVSKGFKAVNSVRVRFSTEDSEKIGKVIDAGIDSGAMLSYINFELSQALENQYKAEALKLATEDARIKAEAIAEGLGTKLGKVVSVSTSDFGYSPWIAYDNRGMEYAASSAEIKEASTSIQPGEQEIMGRVSVAYKLN